MAASMLSCFGKSHKGLAGLLTRLGVRGLVWERAGRVTGSVVELASWRTSNGGGGGDDRGVVYSIEESRVYDSFNLWLFFFARLRRGQYLQKGADLVSGSLVQIGGLPLAHGLDHPS